MNDDPAAVIVRRTIRARPDTVFSFFTDRDRWLSWQGITAEIDARPGGVFRMNVRGDGFASGRFVVVEPHHRLVFTWGWEGDGSPVPPGSSTVEITLVADSNDSTLLTLVHTGLPFPALDAHRSGWDHYLDRLTTRATGGDPGPDTSVDA
ncbi:SRPBCC domain-containing protein [Kribbella sp. NPDC050124]|uniref:SRPBCC domain-containing protein n=1 Tax=Kribbella sp. NPDC050124 TaxID=3364114 RepID=UPI0037B78937